MLFSFFLWVTSYKIIIQIKIELSDVKTMVLAVLFKLPHFIWNLIWISIEFENRALYNYVMVEFRKKIKSYCVISMKIYGGIIM